MKTSDILGIGAVLAYTFIFIGLSLGDAIRERRLQKQLGKNYEGPAAE